MLQILKCMTGCSVLRRCMIEHLSNRMKGPTAMLRFDMSKMSNV